MRKQYWIPVSAFILVFLFTPVSMIAGLDKMPGDIGDARLNNYFLENVYQFLSGKTESLWHLPFFAPFPYVLGFSDNLFGSSPIYILMRLFDASADTAYQIWFLFGYAVNFAAAYYALRRLNGSVLAASVGALIFTFALPTTAHAGHAQLHYRFGLPLALAFLAHFYDSRSWRHLLIAGAWLVWQFYAGVYIGFFTLLLMATMSFAFFGSALARGLPSAIDAFKQLVSSWRAQPRKEKTLFLVGLILLFLLLIVLFYPYLQVSRLYGAERSWSEISVMLPRLQSYFLADASFLWSSVDARIFSGLPMRHEHQMFIGIAPLMLALVGCFVGSREKNGSTFSLMGGMLGLAIVLTLYVGGFSLWYFLHKLPLASAIRAMTRLDQALLFPIAYFAAIAVDDLRARFRWGQKAIFIVLIPFMIAEAGMTSMHTSEKRSWRQRLSALESVAPNELPDNSILFFAQRSGPPFADELDAMWVSLKNGAKTLNGYSGLFPPEYSYEFGQDCAEIPKRILSYLNFIRQPNNGDLYRGVMSRVVHVGFVGCDTAWWESPPSVTSAVRAYTADEFRGLSLSDGKVFKDGAAPGVRLHIQNSREHAFSAKSEAGTPIRVSWRYVDSTGQPRSGWETRKNIPFDIPANGALGVFLPLKESDLRSASAVQISLVQEAVFWGHDVGVQPLTVSLDH